MADKSYTVTGMTCGHCVSAVRRRVGGVAGVERVAVDLVAERVTVTGNEFSDGDVRAAVEAAGYVLVCG